VNAAPRYAWVGDDFTGASDTLSVLACGGLRALLFLDVPTPARLAAAGPLDAVGIATAARAMAPAAMRAALRPIGDWLATCGAPLLHYKVCSTWDSAPGTGNVAAAVDALHRPGFAPWVPLVGGQPSLGRWCVFGQLFAQAGPGGAVHRIDRHPTMSRHPVTPMDEADLAAHLGRQGLPIAAAIDWRTLDGPVAALDAALRAAIGAAPAPRAVLLDTLTDAHLAAIGAAIARHAHGRPVLAVGASSVAQAMLAGWRAAGLASDALAAAAAAPVAPADGPVLVLAGSLSPRSARQVARATRYERVPLDAARLVAGSDAYRRATAAAIGARLAAGANVLAGTALGADAPAQAAPALAPACGALLAAVLRDVPCRRVGVVGGDTSSHTVRALAPWALGWVGRIGQASPLVRAHSDDPRVHGLELMLKGGQIGEDDVLDRLVAGG
jgi:uncharacterized protein YgbK (DUF1537 family)